MKFRYKILIINFIIIILFLDIGIFLIMKKSFQINIKQETDRTYNEYILISNNIMDGLDLIKVKDENYRHELFITLTKTYADFYSNQGILIKLLSDENIIFSNVTLEENIIYNNKVTFLEFDGKQFLRIKDAFQYPFNNFELCFYKDITSVFAMQDELLDFFYIMNIIICFCLIIVINYVFKSLVKPLNILSNTTKKISSGNYSERVIIENNDEFKEVADNFNEMAISIEKTINQLFNISEAKQILLDTMSHEIRTPLTSIKGFAEYISNTNCTEEEIIIATNHIKNEADRLNKLSAKLLNISKLKNTDINFKKVGIDKLIDSSSKIVKISLKKKNIKLIIKKDMDYIYGDLDLFISLLSNCIENAINASKENSSIKIFFYLKNDKSIIEIDDEGIGISKEDLENIFEPFYRVDKFGIQPSTGVGLGLPLCKEIVNSLGGTIEFMSELNKGTKVRIILQPHNNSKIVL